MQTYAACKSDDKINLTAGAYRTEDLKPYVFPSVRKAEKEVLIDNNNRYRGYMNPLGCEELCKNLSLLFFGKEKYYNSIIKKNRLFSCQSLSGTGALSLIAEFISKHGKDSQKTVYLPKPTWPNHQLIFTSCGLKVEEYNFYDHENLKINFDYMTKFLNNANKGATILFHTCAFNPTGTDFNKEQWLEIVKLVKDKNLFTIFDTAYQGFSTGDIEQDNYPIYLFLDYNVEFAIAQSLSKNMGMYGERTGGLHIVFNEQKDNQKLINKFKYYFSDIILSLYLTPVDHGALIIKTVLEKYKEDWIKELKEVVNRVLEMRNLLYKELVKINCPGNWKIILDQNGMFAYTGLSEKQCDYLINNKNLFLVKSGRINICGINKKNVSTIASFIKEAKLNA